MDDNKLLFSQLEQNFLWGYDANGQYDVMAYKSSLSLIRPYIPEQRDDESDEDFEKRWDETAFDYEEINADTEEITNYLDRNTSFDLGGLIKNEEICIKIDHNIEIRLEDGFKTNQLILNGGHNYGSPEVFSFFNLSFESNHQTLVGEKILQPGVENDLKPLNTVGGFADPEVLIHCRSFRSLRRRIWFLLIKKYKFNICWIPAIEVSTDKEFQLFKSLMFLNYLQIFDYWFVFKIFMNIKSKNDLLKLRSYRDLVIFFNEAEGLFEISKDEDKSLFAKELDNSLKYYPQTVGVSFPPELRGYKIIEAQENGNLISIGLNNKLQKIYDDFLDTLDFRNVNHRMSNKFAIGNYVQFVEFIHFDFEDVSFEKI